MSSEAAILNSGPCAQATRMSPTSLTGDRVVDDPDGDSQRKPLLRVHPAVEALDDESLLEKLRGSDREALAVLFRRYARAVRSTALRILRSESEADDLVQDVFLFIFQKPSFDPSRGSGRTWILMVAYNRALDRRQYLSSRHFYSSQDFEESSFQSSDGREEKTFWGSPLEEALGRDFASNLKQELSVDQLETIRLHLFEGHSLKEAAEIMGQSLVNVRNFYYRGLERIRKIILPAITPSK